MRSVGQRLSQLRKERELGQKELAALLNMSIGTISNYENNVHAPDLATLCKLADFFQVTTDYLLGRTGYRCPPENLDRYITSDYTIHGITNVILSLDSKSRDAAISYVNYLRDTQNSR
ncbi:helix-turn-helix domain-containing protein [Acetatifactor muris]|jgi:transcriptional regulator with XRE-family HTH domain|uniref:HTH-type transcriptional regulator Xre n=1 Tax=Acetatifactor muris TaxID=879566 RepID=A0A2K4ZCB9_9FIRM|nr:helix-turn-helix transcriptional regulator [Acetatifactor muris]MCR2046330.1 helix-turn-helix domain-containing protein [Acetatifactor muris]SOY28102.1 HTH-type transcriptional regulator Xre [Acetatifactor muris]